MAGVRGQGRKFDLEDVLEKAMFVFWRHGYDGASVATLSREMGINAPSLYAAFGSKEGLFFAAVDYYNNGRGSFMQRAFDEEDRSPALIQRLLREAADTYTHSDGPGGCLVIGSATRVSDTAQQVADRLRDLRNANIDRLEARIGADIDAGTLPAGTDARAVAEFAGVIIQGMSHRARDGATTEALRTVAGTAWESLRVLLGETKGDASP
ncbi:TetR/AcrR family transcriptional regulator [Streptomyces sp. NPDC001480]|uniref:TetR/AcrR family transcriptional regulator n=1 Tax=Streptomyces sp. NPDC001480 TaxID=3364577 RepID=UPI0036C2AFCD